MQLSKILSAARYGLTPLAPLVLIYIKVFAGKRRVLAQQLLKYGAHLAEQVVCVAVAMVFLEIQEHMLRKQLQLRRDVLFAVT
jgi:hypothetical protein